eukprot:s805_g29.t3
MSRFRERLRWADRCFLTHCTFLAAMPHSPAMRSVLPPLPTLVKDLCTFSCCECFVGEGPQVRRAALLARVRARSSALAGLDDLDRKKREVALAAVTANGIALQWAPDRFKNDKEVVLAAVASAGQALKYVGKALQADRDVVSAAVQQNGLALHFASPRLRRDKELVLEACHRDGAALLFADDQLRKDEDCKDIASMNAHSIQSASTSVRSSRSSRERSRFVASTRDGRWPSLLHWSYHPFLAASNARAVGDSEAARRRSMRAGQTFSGWQGRSRELTQ